MAPYSAIRTNVDNPIKRAARKAGVFWGPTLKASVQHKLT
jgi:hypothetical protein